jgi:hypothetical protein
MQGDAMTMRHSKKKKDWKRNSCAGVEQAETAPESGTDYDGRSDKFPEIKGDKKMKDVRLALLNDLKKDGIVKRNVPFST